MRPYYDRGGITIYHGDVLACLAALPEESVHCVVTSPPYWGLRDYGTGTWDGGDPACDHQPSLEWIQRNLNAHSAFGSGGKTQSAAARVRWFKPDGSCPCGARRIDHQIGLEPTPEAYLARMVGVFREVRRVLRSDGTAWVNMGDGYATGTNADRPSSTSTEGEKVPAGWASRCQTTRRDAGLKPKDLIGMPWRLAFALQADGWWLRSEIIWCLSGGARVYAKTQKGVMPTTIKDLVRLDPSTVKLWNGEKWTQVLGWSQSPSRNGALEIELRSGERVGCTPGHRWPTQRGLVRADNLKAGDVIDSCRLPGCDGPMPSHLAGVAWCVGHYLAEGSRSGTTIQIACNQSEVEEVATEWAALAGAFGGTFHRHKTSKGGAVVCVESKIISAIIDEHIAGRTAKNKHLTRKAWERNDYWLAEFLDGYLFGDGHRDEKNNRWRVGFTRNDAWAADLRTICARLGYSLTLNAATGEGFGKRWPIYRGEIREAQSGHHNEKPRSEVVSIDKSRARKFWDIGVADDPHTFALASGVLTHNSKPNPMPESVTDRPTKSHETVFLLAKSARYFFDADAVREASTTLPQNRCATPSGRESMGDLGPGLPAHRGIHQPGREEFAGRNLRDVWMLATEPTPFAHFATFPRKLVQPCVRAGTSERGVCPECGAPWARDTKIERTRSDVDATSEKAIARAQGDGYYMPNCRETGGVAASVSRSNAGWSPTCDHGKDPVPATVLDPFAGSLTTLAVARDEGCRAIGIELNSDYIDLGIKHRLSQCVLPFGGGE